MKKFLIIFLSLLMTLQCVVFANAALYNKDSRYTIDLPDEFNEVEENKFIGNNSSAFSVSFEDNTEEKFCIADMNEDDVRNFVDEMVSSLNSFSADLNIKAIAADKIKHNNGKNAIFIVLEQTYLKDGEKKATYQKLYMFSGEENIITFTYTIGDKEKLDDLDSAFDSIAISENELEGESGKTTKEIITDKIISVAKKVAVYAVITILMVLGIIWFVKRRNR